MKQYFGIQTEKALVNFPYPLHPVSLDLIYAIVEIKKACSRANLLDGLLDITTSSAIQKACDQVLKGMYDSQFVTCSIQGGAGTSINMNVNEVLASVAQSITKDKISIHPIDHVNLSQSTNDVNPSALRILSIRKLTILDKSLSKLITEFNKKAKKYRRFLKLGRTHLQDAVPIYINDELTSYAYILELNRKRIHEAKNYLYSLNLGGTAIGNGINASKQYQRAVIKELRSITNIKVVPSKNKIASTSTSSDFVHLSNIITLLCNDLSKIAHDIRLLSSGPNGGIGEVHIEERQHGSSIMPGKVNPVIPESINQIYYFVSGKNLTISQAAEAACLELSIMFPVIAEGIISSLEMTTTAIDQLRELCIKTLLFDTKRCQELLEKSSAFATLLNPKLGYDTVSQLVKESKKQNIDLKKIIIKKKILIQKELDAVIKNAL